MSITIADSLANPHIVCMGEHHVQPEEPSHALIHGRLQERAANSNRQKGNGRKQVSSRKSNMRHSGANVRKPRHYPP